MSSSRCETVRSAGCLQLRKEARDGGGTGCRVRGSHEGPARGDEAGDGGWRTARGRPRQGADRPPRRGGREGGRRPVLRQRGGLPARGRSAERDAGGGDAGSARVGVEVRGGRPPDGLSASGAAVLADRGRPFAQRVSAKPALRRASQAEADSARGFFPTEASVSVAEMEFRILGPLEARADGKIVELGAGKPRALLAILLLNANRVVSSDVLIESLWGERAPGTANKALQIYVSQLRKALGRERIVTVAPGYELRLELDELDLDRFERFVADGEYIEALALWRGAPLADVAYEPFAQSEIARLQELWARTVESRIEEDLAAGRHAPLVAELEALVEQYPLRERFRAQLMLALYRSGRQAEALEAYQDVRGTLVGELGIEPSHELRDLHRRILAQDPVLDVGREYEPGTEI